MSCAPNFNLYACLFSRSFDSWMNSDWPRSSSSSTIYRAGLGRRRRERMVMVVFRRWRLCLPHKIWRRRFNTIGMQEQNVLPAEQQNSIQVQYRSRARHLSYPTRLRISAISLHTLIYLGCLSDSISKTLGDRLELWWEEFPTHRLFNSQSLDQDLR